MTAAASPEIPYSAVDLNLGFPAKARHQPAAISAADSMSGSDKAPFSCFTGAAVAVSEITPSAAATSSGRISGGSVCFRIAFSDVFTCTSQAMLHARFVARIPICDVFTIVNVE